MNTKTFIARIEKPFRWFVEISWKKKMMLVGLPVFIAFTSYTLIRGQANSVEYKLEKVKRGSVARVVSETGRVTAAGKIDVVSSITGVVEEVYVKNGDKVGKGQDLFKVTSIASKEERVAAYSTYMTALNNLKAAEQGKINAKLQRESARKAVFDAQNAVDVKSTNLAQGTPNPTTQKPYTQNEIDSINTALTSARIAFDAASKAYDDSDTVIEAAEASFKSVEIAYRSTIDGVIVKSSVEGTVVNLSVAKSDKVMASSAANAQATQAAGASQTTATSESTGANPALMIVTDDSSRVKVPINETKIKGLKVGQQATISLDALKDKKFKGEVNRIDEVGTNTQGVVTYNVYITVPDAELQMQPGMTANVDIETDHKENVMTVPNGALKLYKGEKAVRIIDKKNGQPIYVPVKIGIVGVSKTEIKSGLSEGGNIVIGGG